MTFLSFLMLSSACVVPSSSASPFALLVRCEGQERQFTGDSSPHNPVNDLSAMVFAQRIIEQRIIIRVPMTRLNPASEERRREPRKEAPVEWEERKGPRCVQVAQLRAASMAPQSVDMMLRDSTRLRARFSRDCRAEDLYSGFYIHPDEDGYLCSGRDRVQARGGASCLITDFKRLVPKR